jgi:Tfp pilus assembly protein PilO
MPKSSKLKALKTKIVSLPKRPAGTDPRLTARIVVGLLVLANIVAAVFAFRPWEDSPLQVEQRIIDARKQSLMRRTNIERLKVLVAKSEKARKEGEQFMSKYFLSRRTAASTLVSELTGMAKASGIKPREHSFGFEQLEGSDNIAVMTITANYEGTYADLLQYINRVDRSPRFFILENLAAAPQQGGNGVLNISAKVNIFVRDDGSVAPVALTPEQPQARGAGL